jgi:RimJ/RimL family protein N-acetyltransferase
LPGGSPPASVLIVRMRPATLDDVLGILDVQQPGAVAALTHIFPQREHPFPREQLIRRWQEEVADPDTRVFVSTDDAGQINGFAAIGTAQLVHFGTAVDSWGSGLAEDFHDAVLEELVRTAPPGTTQLRLRVFEQNHRARRFYERLGWTPTGSRTRSSFAPHPILLEYRRPLEPAAISGLGGGRSTR